MTIEQIDLVANVLMRAFPSLHAWVAQALATEILRDLETHNSRSATVDTVEEDSYSMTPSRTVADRWWDN